MRDLVDISFLFDKRYKEIGIIDVRSENEFLEDHIPNAINIPILNNEERAIVGTIYKQKGHKDARLKGVSIVAPKLEDFIMKVKDVTDRFGDTLIYCWRGGLRSEASVTFSRLAGLTVSRLSGGYKSYRSEVNRFMEEDVGKFNFITVYGPTGSAKTKILSFINSDQYPFLDIEKYACHKGSSFGHIEEAGYPFVTQKNFESNIYYDLICRQKKLILTEGESKKVGKVVIPKNIFKKMTSGFGVLVKPSIEFRIKFTIENYNPQNNIAEIKNSLNKIKRYLDGNLYNEMLDLLDRGEFEKFTEIILVKYYDPLYKHSYIEKVNREISFDSIDEGIKKIKEIYDEVYYSFHNNVNLCS